MGFIGKKKLTKGLGSSDDEGAIQPILFYVFEDNVNYFFEDGTTYVFN